MTNQEINAPSECIQDFSDLSKAEKELIMAAVEARKFAYVPYSNFKVGSAIRVADDSIIGGCNIENSAYSPTICAERTAVCKAISTGHTGFKAFAVVGYQERSFTTPCGVCRQFISEFCKDDIPFYITKPEPSKVLITSLRSLLPMGFAMMPDE